MDNEKAHVKFFSISMLVGGGKNEIIILKISTKRGSY
jgi:hypothetical protein